MFRTMVHYLDTVELIIHGGANGADQLAGAFGEAFGIAVATFKADWSRGKSGGPIRNQRMLDEAKPDMVLAFPGGTGTANMVKLAKEANVKVVEVK